MSTDRDSLKSLDDDYAMKGSECHVILGEMEIFAKTIIINFVPLFIVQMTLKRSSRPRK